MTQTFDFYARARRAMADAGFAAQIPDNIAAPVSEYAVPEIGRDLRSLLWSSIDNEDTRDLDQVEYAEALAADVVRLMIGIADVDALVPKDSPIDRFAAAQTTSVYTGVATFPMLPEQLSTDLTSLRKDADRQSIVVDMLLAPDGSVQSEAYNALVRNQAQLAYESVGPWLDGRAAQPKFLDILPTLPFQARLQDRAAERLMQVRQRAGALDFDTMEPVAVIHNGSIKELSVRGANRSRDLIENFMIAANTSLSRFLTSSGYSSIQRVMRAPERWPRIAAIAHALGDRLPDIADSQALSAFLSRRRLIDPEGYSNLSLSIVKLLGPGEYALVRAGQPPPDHFGLAVHGYSHCTAPNRRYVDLVTQRVIKAAFSGAPCPYSNLELESIANHCNERAGAAQKVERLMRKVAAAVLMRNNIGHTFDGIVTGASPKGTYARLLSPPAEGRVVEGARGLDVGDRVRVRLVETDPEHGFIDFALAH